MDDQDRILSFLRTNGPSTSSKVAKSIQQDSIITSAHLSDLKSRGKLIISDLKIGASPLYYLEGDEHKLFDFADGNMNPKDLIVLKLLRERKVLHEENLDLLGKVALRNLKDFAIPLHVTLQGQKKLFWKWHLLSPDETNQVIGEILGMAQQQEVPAETVAEPEEIVEKEVVEEVAPEVEEEPELEQDSELTEVKEEPEVLEDSNEDLIEKPELEEEPEDDLEEKEQLAREIIGLKDEEYLEVDTNEELEEEKSVESKKNKKEIEEPVKEKAVKKVEDPKEKQKKLGEVESEKKKKPFLQKFKEKLTGKKRSSVVDEFSPLIEDFFTALEIEVEQKDIVRKNSEVNLIVSVPSIVGKMKYFCKAKSKAKADEKDISTAYMEAQIKKLPLLFVYSNSLSPKAQEMLETGAFENTVVKKIE